MGFIDEKRSVSELPIKPRRTKGTPAHRARNIFATSLIAGGIALGLIYMWLPSTSKIRKSMREYILPETEETRHRRQYKSFGIVHSSHDIAKLMESLGRPLNADVADTESTESTEAKK